MKTAIAKRPKPFPSVLLQTRNSETPIRPYSVVHTGIIHKEEREEYALAYRKQTASQVGKPTLQPKALEPHFKTSLDHPIRIVIAGAAGQKVVRGNETSFG
jgi:hypothetical protein